MPVNEQPDNEEIIEEKVRSDVNIEQVLKIQHLVKTHGNFESPIDINLAFATPITLSPLEWFHLELPSKKMKLSNTGHTLLLSATWHNERPYIYGGPLLDAFIFSQLHFHWGCNNMEGSEHTVDGSHYPFEMHVVYYNKRYEKHEMAIRERDGVSVLAYLFKLQARPNPAVQLIIEYASSLQKPRSAVRMENLPLIFIVRKFVDDYFLYWGSINTTTGNHVALWLICREPIGISVDQVECFRSLLDENEDPLYQNFRPVQPLDKRKLFHVTPGPSKYATFLQISEEQNLFQDLYKYDVASKVKNEETE